MRLFLAPMEGVVDFHLRKLYATVGGIDACVTEFVRINQHILPQKVFTKTCPELLSRHSHVEIQNKRHKTLPIRIQLLGSDPKLLGENAKKAAEIGAQGIDLNFGCPAKTVNKNRGGACLLDETELIHQIILEVRKQVPSSIPVTAKIRLGYNDRSTYLDNARAIQDAGASELFVHARSKADGYNPPAYWHMIGDINAKLDIPVIANGEVWTLDDYKRCKAESGCSDIMLGRGLLANPGLAREIKTAEGLMDTSALAWNDVATLLQVFLEETANAYPARFMGNRVKQWLHYLRRHFNEAEHLFEKIKREKQFDTIALYISEST